MESIDDSHYLEPPVEREWCAWHEHRRPCPDCKADAEEWHGEQRRETR